MCYDICNWKPVLPVENWLQHKPSIFLNDKTIYILK